LQENIEPEKTVQNVNLVTDSLQDQPVPEEPQNTENDTQQLNTAQETKVALNKNTTWIGNWGNDIVAIVNTEPCSEQDFLKEGYGYLITSSIPVARLKKPSDAFFVSGGRAATVMGCWFKKDGGLIHVKMKRKHDGKIWETDNNLDDSSIWTSESGAEQNKLQQDSLDEANKRINIVWNGATKEMRALLLPEQKEWLKQRESNCSLKASKGNPSDDIKRDTIRFNCMAAMTELRADVLNQKISSILNNRMYI
jgi:uncharacterized protein YecT (DUF1311 family)